MLLIVGLGNPGAQYEETRHNAGFWFARELARRHDIPLRNESRFLGETGRGRIGAHEVRLLLPQTFMNRSGAAVAALAGFFRIPPPQILVAYDEIDLPPGTVRLKVGGGHGGHNGVRDIVRHLGADFLRLRLGVGRPAVAEEVVGYVLRKPPAEERNAIEAAIGRALEEAPLIVGGELQAAMNRLHAPE